MSACDDAAAVHVRVGLDRADERAHPVRRLAQLADEAVGGDRGRERAERGRGCRSRGGLHLCEPVVVDAGDRQRLRESPRIGDSQRLEPFAHLVFGVGGVERGQGAALARLAEGLFAEIGDPGGALAFHAGVDERPQRRVHHVQRLTQLLGRPPRRRRRVVQLVREPGGHRAERGEPLPVLLDRGDPAHQWPDLAHDPAVHRRVCEREPPELRRRDHGSADRGRRDHADADRGLGQRRHGADPRRRGLLPCRLEPVAVVTEQLQRPFEQEQQPLGLGVLLEDDVPGLGVAPLGGRRPLGELGVVEVVEQVDRPEVGDGDRCCACRAHASARYWCTSETAIDPSPTALATRLIDRARTSPATNTPGTLVSSGNGSR